MIRKGCALLYAKTIDSKLVVLKMRHVSSYMQRKILSKALNLQINIENGKDSQVEHSYRRRLMDIEW